MSSASIASCCTGGWNRKSNRRRRAVSPTCSTPSTLFSPQQSPPERIHAERPLGRWAGAMRSAMIMSRPVMLSSCARNVITRVTSASIAMWITLARRAASWHLVGPAYPILRQSSRRPARVDHGLRCVCLDRARGARGWWRCGVPTVSRFGGAQSRRPAESLLRLPLDRRQRRATGREPAASAHDRGDDPPRRIDRRRGARADSGRGSRIAVR